LENQNNYIKLCRKLKYNEQCGKKFDVLATSLNVLHNYFDLFEFNKIIFRFVSS